MLRCRRRARRGGVLYRYLLTLPVVQYCTGKKTPGGAGTHTGHTRDTRAHTGTRITQMNLTTIQTQRHTRTAARPRDGRNRGRLNKRRPGADRSPRPTHWYTKCVLPVQLVWHVFGRTTSTGKRHRGEPGQGTHRNTRHRRKKRSKNRRRPASDRAQRQRTSGARKSVPRPSVSAHTVAGSREASGTSLATAVAAAVPQRPLPPWP